MARGDVVIAGIVFTPADRDTLRLIRAEPYSAKCARLAQRLCLSHNGAKKRLDHLRLQTATSSVDELLEWIWRNGAAIDRALAGIAHPDAVRHGSVQLGSYLDVDQDSGMVAIPSPRDDGDDMNRRQFLQEAGKLAGGLVGATWLESLEIDRDLETSRVGPATLEQLDRTVDRFGHEYLWRPLPELLIEVRAWRQYVVALLRSPQTLAQRRHFCSTAGWLSSLLGSLSFDLGHAPSAEAHHRTALRLAREAGNDRLAAWVQGCRALMALYTVRYEAAVTLAEGGQEVAVAGTPTAVRLFSLEARGHARMGDRASFEHAVGRAADAFDKVPELSSGVFSFAAPWGESGPRASQRYPPGRGRRCGGHLRPRGGSGRAGRR